MTNGVRWIVGITGASGVRYAQRLVQVLVEKQIELHVVISESAYRVFQEEEGIANSARRTDATTLFGVPSGSITVYDPRDIGAKIASGSAPMTGMVVIPCSMNTLGALAHGTGESLLHRAADVTLKERRPLIVVPRETPLSLIHLKNMVALAEAGAQIVPAMPGFYAKPQSIEDLIDHMVMKVLDCMRIDSQLVPRWRS